MTVITVNGPDVDAPRASGTLDSHYAPTAKVQLMTALELQNALDAYSCATATIPDAAAATGTLALAVAVWSRSPVKLPHVHVAQFKWQSMPASAGDCAHQLFAQLRSFDAQGVAHIWVEAPPPTPEWDGVRDRLTRAATPTR